MGGDTFISAAAVTFPPRPVVKPGLSGEGRQQIVSRLLPRAELRQHRVPRAYLASATAALPIREILFQLG
jgi:hypothetical protein